MNVPPQWILAIERAQPFTVPYPRLHPMYVLHRLDITTKHRLLIPIEPSTFEWEATYSVNRAIREDDHQINRVTRTAAMFTRVSYVQETVEDLNVAFGNLQGAGGHQTLQRRALKATLDNLYRLRAHRAEAQTYLRRSDSCDAGRITEGITYLRGVLTHHITKPVAPENQPLYPGDDVYPSEDLFPGTNLTWLDASDVFRMQPQPAGGRRKVQAEFYRSHVGGRLVLTTIRVAREFLINDPQLGPL